MKKLMILAVVASLAFGTLDEICEIITWNQLSIINKPVSFLNSNNFFTPFKQFVEFASAECFISTPDLKKVQWLNKMDEFKW